MKSIDDLVTVPATTRSIPKNVPIEKGECCPDCKRKSDVPHPVGVAILFFRISTSSIQQEEKVVVQVVPFIKDTLISREYSYTGNPINTSIPYKLIHTHNNDVITSALPNKWKVPIEINNKYKLITNCLVLFLISFFHIESVF